MMMRAIVASAFLLTAACGDDTPNKLPDAPPVGSLIIEPPDVQVTVENGVAVVQSYRATAVDPDGTQRDVTGITTFTLRDPQYGNWTGSSLAVTGMGSGPTRVIGNANGVTGDTGLTVFVKDRVVDPGVDPSVPGGFDAATEDPTLAPTIVYPLDKILVPPNLGQFDVHWTTGNTNVFELRMSNEYVDIKRYTTGLDPQNPVPFWTIFQPNQWYPIASSRQQLTLRVAAMNTSDTSKKGTAPEQHVDVTNEDARGGIYYWTTSTPQGIFRYEVTTPNVPPAPFFPGGAEPGGSGNCMGCHTLSRDGSKIALTIDGGDGRGTVYDVADRRVMVPFDSGTPAYWNFATFSPDGTRLLTVKNGLMSLRATEGGAELAPIPNRAGKLATHPEISPDGTRLVNVESADSGFGQTDYFVFDGALVVRSFDQATNTFGPVKELVAQGADGLDSYYPSFSPDGQWIVFTRAPGLSYNNLNAETWVMKADGTQAPIKLQVAGLAQGNLTNSWARWVPFAQTFGGTNETMFYLTFSSQRPFGVRIPGGGLPQIWMTPFFPARAAAGQDPSGPAFRVPFQDVTTGNHIAQWTQTVVVQ
ncbi:MAG: PD40 domain-containing protein [Deltaproteobacteria bacterium]|nr:PD40 domain-containing protein [Deltaproteobacteria bacterium]